VDRDLKFISGDFFHTEIPRDKLYLNKYFTTPIQQAFLKYYLVFGEWSCFVEHTGMHCLKPYMRTQEKRFHWIQALHRKAKDHVSISTL
jgi:hypothetical protein